MSDKSFPAERLSVERQETDPWAETELLTLTTGEINYDFSHWSVKRLDEAYATAYACLLQLNKGGYPNFPDFLLKLTDKRAIRQAFLVLSDEERYNRLKRVVTSPKVSPVTAGQTLKSRRTNASVHDLQKSNDLPLEDQIQKTLEETTKSHLLSISDSHQTTGSVFEALSNAWTYKPSETAIFCVDHHTDTYFPETPDLYKSTVMRWLLNKRLVGAIGMIGVQPVEPEDRVPGAHFITGTELYTEKNQPDQAALDLFLESLFHKWQRQGIKQVYLSIDLDGLRIDQQHYTATDYSHTNRLFELLARLEQFDASCENPTHSNDKRYKLLQNALQKFMGHEQPYQGIPATWITRAVRLMKDDRFNFTLGVVDQKTGKKLIGDVVEFSGRDLGGYTSRITVALLEKLAQLGQ